MAPLVPLDRGGDPHFSLAKRGPCTTLVLKIRVAVSDAMIWLKQPAVYRYKKPARFVVAGDFEHEGIAYERKTISLTGNHLQELLAIADTEQRKRRAVELATGKWLAKYGLR